VKATGKYKQVLHVFSGTIRHYLLKDAKEDCAEMTDVDFGVNDLYPFAHAESGAYDPETATLLRTIWKTPVLDYPGLPPHPIP
jgi:hypothetical protein